jgi:N-acetylglutamate synthase-like GNAT family acetyltransferase
VESVVVEAVEAGDVQLNGLRAIEVSLATWSMSEGTHMIAHVQGVAEQLGIADPYRLMLRHQQTLLNGLGWQPLFDATDEAALDAKIEKLCQEVFHDLQCPEKKS